MLPVSIRGWRVVVVAVDSALQLAQRAVPQLFGRVLLLVAMVTALAQASRIFADAEHVTTLVGCPGVPVQRCFVVVNGSVPPVVCPGFSLVVFEYLVFLLNHLDTAPQAYSAVNLKNEVRQ